MGGVCDSCFGTSQSSYSKPSNERTSLLSGNNSAPAPTSQRAYSNSRLAYDERINTGSHSPGPHFSKIVLDNVGMPGIDKRMQDPAQLYNEIISKRKELIQGIQDLCQAARGTEKSLEEAFQYIRSKTGGDKAAIKRRSQYCMEIEYDPSETLPEVHRLYMLFNKVNRLCKDLIEKTPPLKNSIELLVGEEETFKREIIVASMESANGVDAIQMCVNNMSKLRALPNYLETIKNDAHRRWDELLRASSELVK